MLLTVYLDEDFIDVKCVTVTSMFSLQPTSINSSEFDTPETDCFSADDDASFCEEIFNIAMTEVEAIITPDGVGNDIWWGAPSWNRWRL
tara:strand:+ start:199 stop:465 length:267 start_codon:yes stop_codon:yes gene_type:complete